jgi:protein arginine phosphatase
VCTGNLCRSPMAEGLFRMALHDRRCTEVEVASAGTWAYVGSPATSEAAQVVAQRGADISEHRSRPLSKDEVDAADLVVVMTSVHKKEILDVAPAARDKMFLLKELGEISPRPRLGGGLSSLWQGQRPSWRRELDLDDPIGLPLGAYKRCARLIHEGTELLANVLCGPPVPPDPRSS